MRNPARKSGLRPQRSALRPTNIAIGTMMICAATMQADISVVPSVPVLKRELLSDQRQHRGIGKVEEHHAGGKNQQRPAGQQDVKAGRLRPRPGLADRQSCSPRARS